MKRKSLIALLVAPVVLFASCAKEADSTTEVMNKDGNFNMTVYASVSEMDGDETKADMGDVLIYGFTTGDKVSVVNASTGKYLGNLSAIVPTEGGKIYQMENTLFSGNLTGAVAKGDELAFIYPATDTQLPGTEFTGYDAAMDNQVYSAAKGNVVTFSASATIPSNFDSGEAYDVEPMKVLFTPVTSVIAVSFYGLPASSQIESMTIKGIGTAVNWTVSGGQLVATTVNDNAGSINLAINGALSSNARGTRAISVAVPKSSASEGRDIAVKIKNSWYGAEFTKAALDDGKYYTMILGVKKVPEIQVEVRPATEGVLTSAVYVKNTGNIPAYIRAAFIANWVNEAGEIVAPSNGTLTVGESWSKDGLFYKYNQEIAPGSEVAFVDSYGADTKPAGADHLAVTVLAQGRETAF